MQFRLIYNKNEVGMKIENITNILIELKQKDISLRDHLIQSGQLGEHYNQEMEALHNSNANELGKIIDARGYPTIDKVGEEASDAARLIIQHAIGQPDFMRKCAKLLEIAVKENEANPIHLAYLTDRIAVFEGKPQCYGTQFDWDEYGQMSANRYDDIITVNERRKSIGMNSLQEQTEIMSNQVIAENQKPPKDFKVRKVSYDQWRRSVGWIDK